MTTSEVVSMQQVAITTFRPSENAELSRALFNMETNFEQAARQNVESALESAGSNIEAWTDLEKRAMVVTEELRLLNGMDLAAILLRGKFLQEIEAFGLWSVHPNHYNTLEALAEDQGISLSELSDIRTMTQIIFPWIEREMGVPIALIWEKVGKSKFRAMVPVFKALITGELPGRGTARNTVERILDDTAASLRSAHPGEEISEERIRRQAVEDLMTAGEQMSARELREHIRDGEVTPAIQPLIIEADGRKFLLSEVIDDEQMLILQRKLGRHMTSPDHFQAPTDRRRRQTEAMRVRVLREIYHSLFEG